MFIWWLSCVPKTADGKNTPTKLVKNGQWKAKVQAKINLQKSPVIQKDFSNFILNNHGDDWWSLFVIHDYRS